MPSVIQKSFAGGVISEEVQGRTDQSKVNNGLDEAKNMFITRYGACRNRPGREFVGEVYDSTKVTSLRKFVFNDDQTYVIEFSRFRIRIIKDGEYVRLPGAAVTSISNTTPPVVTTAAPHGLTGALDDVVLLGATGIPDLLGRKLNINVTGASAFELTDEVASGVGAGGTYEKVLEITSLYDDTEVKALDVAQSADVMTIVHPAHLPVDLIRVGPADYNWTTQVTPVLPSVDRPTAIGITPGAAGTNVYKYRVTAVSAEGEESLPGVEASFAIASYVAGPPVILTLAGDQTASFNQGDAILIDVSPVGFLYNPFEKATYIIGNVALVGGPNTEITLVDATVAAGLFVSGTIKRIHTETTASAVPTPAAPNVIAWTKPAADNAVKYRVYREINGLYGFIGETTTTTFNDIDIAPNVEVSHPIDRYIFRSIFDYPSTVTYFQQRRVFGNTINSPAGFWMSKTGLFGNFTKAFPLAGDDSIAGEVRGEQVNTVHHAREFGGRPMLLTSDGNWTLDGDDAGILRPTAVNLRRWSSHGSSTVRPLNIGSMGFYVQSRGETVRELTVNRDGISTRNLSIFAPHYFRPDDKNIIAWDYQETPESMIWAVASDGTVHTLTYEPEHDVWAWAEHFGLGDVRDVVTVPEGDEDAVYFIIYHPDINGTPRQYIERLYTRKLDDKVKDSRFLDSHLTYDGTNLTLAGKNLAATMTVTGGPPWDLSGAPFTLTASAGTFAATDVGNDVQLASRGDDDFVRLVISAYTSPTVVSVIPDRAIPLAFQGAATTDWALCVDEVGGMHHLEGETVSVFADGFVLDDQVVAGGKVSLSGDYGYCFVCVGLAYVSDMVLLPLETQDAETLLEKKTLVKKANLSIFETQAVSVGPDAGHLKPAQLRNSESMDSPIEPSTEVVSIILESTWQKQGTLLIRQALPLPMTIRAVVRTGTLGGSQ